MGNIIEIFFTAETLVQTERDISFALRGGK